MCTRTLEQQVTLRGQAKSTFENYIHRIAQVSLHFNCLPEDVIEEKNSMSILLHWLYQPNPLHAVLSNIRCTDFGTTTVM